jgi:fermentation-respiration switch protein FrsA (DUF1100 family)
MSDLVWSAIRIGVTVYAGLCLLVVFRQSKYLYFPDRIIDLTPDAVDLAFEDIVLVTQDGERITGWFVPAYPETPHKPVRTVLFCHGNAGDIGDRVSSVKTFHDLGLNVLLFDYRGYGHSTGRPTEEGTYLDAQAAWNYLKAERGFAPHTIIIFGRSLGGAVAVWLAEQVHPGMLFMESTFASAGDMAATMFPLLPARWLCRYDYNAVRCVRNVRCPVFIAHSPNDETIPFRHAQRIFKAAREPKALVELQGGHNEGGLDACPAAQTAFRAFLDEYAPPLTDLAPPAGAHLTSAGDLLGSPHPNPHPNPSAYAVDATWRNPPLLIPGGEALTVSPDRLRGS